MLGVAEYLDHHGLTLDGVPRLVRPLRDGEALLLVGSVGEGLANPASDLDLLLLDRTSAAHRVAARPTEGGTCEASGEADALQVHSDTVLRTPPGFDLH